jgi:hypothetical protein
MKATYIIIGVLLVILVALLFGVRSLTARLKSSQQVNHELIDTVLTWKNKAGQNVSDKRAAEISLKDAKAFYAGELQQIRETFEIRDKNLRSFISAKFNATGKGSVTMSFDTTIQHSSNVRVHTPMFRVSDGFLDFKGAMPDSATLNYEYSYRDSVIFATSWKKNGLFRKKTLLVSGAFGNKNATITGLRNVVVSDFKDKRFGIGPMVGYDVFSNRPVVGVSVQYSLIRF